jgi:hypothetical protein
MSRFPQKVDGSPLKSWSVSPQKNWSDPLRNSDVTSPSRKGPLSFQKCSFSPQKNLIGSSQKFRCHFSLKTRTPMLSKVVCSPFKRIWTHPLKKSDVTFPSKSGSLSSQKLISFPSKTLIGCSQKFICHFSFKKWVVILSEVDRFPFEQTYSDPLKNSGVTFPSNCGPLSSQKLFVFPSKKFDRILSRIQMSLFPQNVDRYPLKNWSISPQKIGSPHLKKLTWFSHTLRCHFSLPILTVPLASCCPPHCCWMSQISRYPITNHLSDVPHRNHYFSHFLIFLFRYPDFIKIQNQPSRTTMYIPSHCMCCLFREYSGYLKARFLVWALWVSINSVWWQEMNESTQLPVTGIADCLSQ